MCVIKNQREKKTLFGAFSEKLTKEVKVRTWKEINSYGQSIGIIPSNKEWNYLRDVWWPNVRKLVTVSVSQ